MTPSTHIVERAAGATVERISKGSGDAPGGLLRNDHLLRDATRYQGCLL